MVQTPGPEESSVTVVPATVQINGVEDVRTTGSPEEADAVKVTAVP
jgi:hypothetical protein